MISTLALFSLLTIFSVSNAKLSNFEENKFRLCVFPPCVSYSEPAQSQTERVSQKQLRDIRSNVFRSSGSWSLRNCYLSPVQCLLPVDQAQFSKFHKRVNNYS